MSSSRESAQTATDWIFVARSLARMTSGQDQALRCMARAGIRAASANDWIAVASAWETDFGDLALALECLEKGELVAEETEEGWDEIAEARAGLRDFRKVLEICRRVHEPRPWARIDDIQSRGPLPEGTTVLDWIESGETRQASREAVENADKAMENEDTVEAIRCLIDAESLADSTGDYLRVAERYRRSFPELEESRTIMAKAEEDVDAPSDWVWIALKWRNDFQDYENAVACMWRPEGGTADDWEHILRAWRDDFQDPDNFRSALGKAYGEVDDFDQMTSMVCDRLQAYDRIDKASLVDLGTLTETKVSLVGAWDEDRNSERQQSFLAGHYRFSVSQATRATIVLTSDVDNHLHLILGEDPNGDAIEVDQGENNGANALSLIRFDLDAGTYTIEVSTAQVEALVNDRGIFHLEIYL